MTIQPDTSVSHGTMLAEHLIPRFIEVLPEPKRSWYQGRWDAVRTGDADTIADVLAHFDELTSQQEAVDYLCGDLFDELHELAPEGCYFGSHPGDGSDYGFWRVEEEPGDSFLEEPHVVCDPGERVVSAWPFPCAGCRSDITDGVILEQTNGRRMVYCDGCATGC
jgi:hypothetical protein